MPNMINTAMRRPNIAKVSAITAKTRLAPPSPPAAVRCADAGGGRHPPLTDGRKTGQSDGKTGTDGGQTRGGRCRNIAGDHAGEGHDEDGNEEAVYCLRLRDDGEDQSLPEHLLVFSGGGNACGCRDALTDGGDAGKAYGKSAGDGGKPGGKGGGEIAGDHTGEDHDEDGNEQAVYRLRLGYHREDEILAETLLMLGGCRGARRSGDALTDGGYAGKPDGKPAPDGGKPEGQIPGRLPGNHTGEGHDENGHQKTVYRLCLGYYREDQTLSKALFMLGGGGGACRSGDALANGGESGDAHRKTASDGGKAGRLGRRRVAGQKSAEGHDENGDKQAIDGLGLRDDGKD